MDDSSDDDATVDPTLVGKRTGVTIPPRGKIPFDSPGGLYEDPDAFFDAARTPGQRGKTRKGMGGSDDDDDDDDDGEDDKFDGIEHRGRQRREKDGNVRRRRVEEKEKEKGGERERRRREKEELEEEARRNAARRPDILNSDEDDDYDDGNNGEDGEQRLQTAKVILFFHGSPRRGFYSLIVHYFLRIVFRIESPTSEPQNSLVGRIGCYTVRWEFRPTNRRFLPC